MNRYTPSSSRAKALNKTWLEFRELARAIRGQRNMLRTVGTNSAMDVPDAWLSQLEELRLCLEDLRVNVEARAAAIPDGAHPRVLKERDQILNSMDAEFRALYQELFGGVQNVLALLNDPLRTATPFGGSFLDYLSTGADFLKLAVMKFKQRKAKKNRRK